MTHTIGILTSTDSPFKKLLYKLPVSSQVFEKPRTHAVTCQLPPCTQQAPNSPSPQHLARHRASPAPYPRNKGGKHIRTQHKQTDEYIGHMNIHIPTHTPAAASSGLRVTARW